MKKALIILLAFGLVIAGIVLISYCSLNQPSPTDILASRPSGYGNGSNSLAAEKHAKLKDAVQNARHAKVVFMGDSITERWRSEGAESWEKSFQSYSLNLGIDADKTDNLLWRIDDGALALKDSPQLLVLMIGVNNIAMRGDSPQGTCAGIISVIDRIHDLHPRTRIILIGVLPYGKKTYGYFSKRERLNRKLISIRRPYVRYIDLSPHFLNNSGGIKESLSTDYLHLSPLGYQVFAERLRPVIMEELKQSEG